MGAEEQDAALAVVQATSVPIHDIGTTAYLSPDIAGWAAEWGWSNPFAFYFAGRGGMLGDVGADVVTSALGWFAPSAVHAMYSEGIGVAGPTGAAARMAEAHGRWGEKHYGDVEGVEEIVAVTEELVDGLEGSALPLFVGWRDAARADFGPGASGATDADPARMAWREPSGGHDRSRALSLGGHPDQRGSRPGEILRVAGALPGLCRHEATAPRGGGDHGPALRIGTGSCARRGEVLGLRSRGRGAARRRPVAPAGPHPRGGPESGTGYSEGLLSGRVGPGRGA